MADDIEQRLAAAAEAVREHEVTADRCAALSARAAELVRHIDALRAAADAEQKDVDKLEGLSLSRVLAALAGSRDDKLARERAEADAARYRLAEAEARLSAVHREQAAARDRLRQLAGAPGAYAAVLDEKERRLAASADPRGRRILALAEERGRLIGELREIDEAQAAAQRAAQALVNVQSSLQGASGWSTYDTFFGGGVVGSMMKHSRMDAAAQAAAHADRCLAVLRTELADVGELAATAPTLAVDGLTRFVDVWFDNIFTDLAVRERIKRAQDNVAHALRMVAEIQRRLRDRAAHDRARLAAADGERRAILAPPA